MRSQRSGWCCGDDDDGGGAAAGGGGRSSMTTTTMGVGGTNGSIFAQITAPPTAGMRCAPPSSVVSHRKRSYYCTNSYGEVDTIDTTALIQQQEQPRRRRDDDGAPTIGARGHHHGREGNARLEQRGPAGGAAPTAAKTIISPAIETRMSESCRGVAGRRRNTEASTAEARRGCRQNRTTMSFHVTRCTTALYVYVLLFLLASSPTTHRRRGGFGVVMANNDQYAANDDDGGAAAYDDQMAAAANDDANAGAAVEEIGFDGVSVMPMSCFQYGAGHMIKFQLFENHSSYQCHFKSLGTFIVSIAHFMRAYFNYEALTNGQDFSLPSDASYLNCVLIQETQYQDTKLYAKIGCADRETFTSTKLQLHIYSDRTCMTPYDDGSNGSNSRKRRGGGYDLNGQWFTNKVSFRPPFYSCIKCLPDQVSNTFKKGKYWYDDDYINNGGSKNFDDDGGGNYAANDDNAAAAANDDNAAAADDNYAVANDDNGNAAAANDDVNAYYAANDDNGNANAAAANDDNAAAANDDNAAANDDNAAAANDDNAAAAANDDNGGNYNYNYNYNNGYNYNDDNFYAGDDWNRRNLMGKALTLTPSTEAAKQYQDEFWKEVAVLKSAEEGYVQRSLGDDNANDANSIGDWNMCQRLHKYGVWCDAECRAMDSFRADEWSNSDIFLLAIMCVFMAAMMLLVFAKRVKAYEKASIYGDEALDGGSPHYPGLPPMAMVLVFICLMGIIVVLAHLKLVNETLVFAVITCILLFIYMLKLTLFENRGPRLLPAANHSSNPTFSFDSMNKFT